MIGVQNAPTDGCNVFYGNYFDNYNGNIRTRYYIYDGSAIKSSTSTFYNQPSDVECINFADVTPQPFLQAGLIISVIVGVIAVMLSAYMVVVKPFIKIKKG